MMQAPLSFPQLSLWLLEQLYPGHTGANEQFVVRLSGPLQVAELGKAWRTLLERHASLRTTIEHHGAIPLQRVHSHDRLDAHTEVFAHPAV